MNLAELIAVAKGDKQADLLLINAKIVNTFNAEIEEGNVAIYGDRIAGVGNYQQGKDVMDLEGKYLIPSLIDGHIHPESSMLHIARYAEAVVPRGVCAIVTDFHEIANVKGLTGIEYMLQCAKDIPFEVYLMVPSCVPATQLESSGATLRAKDVDQALTWNESIGLGEIMDFPSLLAAKEDILDKIGSASDMIIDGNAPALSGKELNAYIACGIHSDHECTRLDEAREKLARGMHIMIREGSSEKNLEDLLPLVTDQTYKRCLFVVDDRSCDDLLLDGDIDAVVRKAIRLGLNPMRSIQMATINTAEYFRLNDLGAIAPSYRANMFVVPNLSSLKAEKVFYHGKLVAENGALLHRSPVLMNKEMTNTVHIKPFSVDDLKQPALKDDIHVIEIIPDQILTKKLVVKGTVVDGFYTADTERDILKLVVVERHKATGNIGIGFVKGFGLKKGAIGSSFSHDSHNIIAVGTDDREIFCVIQEIERLQGGLSVSVDGIILGVLSLPIAGLLSTESVETVVAKMGQLRGITAKLGCHLSNPFATLSTLALPVIPELRLTDHGLVEIG